MISMTVACWQKYIKTARTLKGKNRKLKMRIADLAMEAHELREQNAYQNAEIQRLLERYERQSLPPGLRFATGIDIRDWHDSLPGPSLIQGVPEVDRINNL